MNLKEDTPKPDVDVDDTMHGAACEICDLVINNLAGNPQLNGIALPYDGGNGELKYYHVGCVVDIISKQIETEDVKKLVEGISIIRHGKDHQGKPFINFTSENWLFWCGLDQAILKVQKHLDNE